LSNVISDIVGETGFDYRRSNYCREEIRLKETHSVPINLAK